MKAEEANELDEKTRRAILDHLAAFGPTGGAAIQRRMFERGEIDDLLSLEAFGRLGAPDAIGAYLAGLFDVAHLAEIGWAAATVAPLKSVTTTFPITITRYERDLDADAMVRTLSSGWTFDDRRWWTIPGKPGEPNPFDGKFYEEFVDRRPEFVRRMLAECPLSFDFSLTGCGDHPNQRNRGPDW